MQIINKKTTTFEDALGAACEGLVYISETDSPVLPFCGTAACNVTGEIILQQTEADTSTPHEEIGIDQFFDKLTVVREWYTEEKRATAKRFLELREMLEDDLHDLKVFRFGKIRLAVYAVGISKDGRLMGITTGAVET